MFPRQLHSYLLWRSSVPPDADRLVSWRYTASVSLLPPLMVGVFVFGWWAGGLVLLSLLTAFVTDFVLHRFVYKASHGTRDGTWLVTGLLVAMMLPPNAHWLFPVVAAAAAVALGKHFLSVDNAPLLQPAVVGLLLLLLIGFVWPGGNPVLGIRHGEPHWAVLEREIEPPAEISARPSSARTLLRDFFGGDIRKSVTRQQYRDAVFDGRMPWYDEAARIKAQAVHGPRPLDRVKADPSQPVSQAPSGTERYGWLSMVLGGVRGTIGGSSALALFCGILLLLFTGAASPVVPLFALATMFTLLHFLAWLNGARVVPENIPIHLLTGSTLLGLFYLAGNPVTAPRSFLGKVYAGVAVGLLEVLLRVFTPLAEGIIVSAVVVQGLSFVIDQWLAPPSEAPAQPVGVTSTWLRRL